MIEKEKQEYQKQRNFRHNLLKIWRGAISIPSSLVKIMTLILFCVLSLFAWSRVDAVHELLWQYIAAIMPIEITQILLIALIIALFYLLLLIFGTPLGSHRTEQNMKRIGFTNDAGEAPVMIARTSERKKRNVKILEFETYGIPLEKWQEKSTCLESALNKTILEISAHPKNKRKIIMKVVKPSSIPTSIKWSDDCLSKDPSKIVLGVGHGEKIIWDLTSSHHAIIGGGTGSGKTVLLRSILHQFEKAGAKVWLADFKGGMDFPKYIGRPTFITEKEALLEVLKELVGELQNRKKDATEMAISKDLASTSFNRFVLAIDEISEVLDTTGLSKDEKKITEEITALLSKIACQGRAYAINLILCTQRPSADILSGQIKSNLDIRICGRADKILSEIVLDSKDAALKVPNDGKGRFVTRDGVEFQGYNFKD